MPRHVRRGKVAAMQREQEARQEPDERQPMLALAERSPQQEQA